jgi:hypothetical protein
VTVSVVVVDVAAVSSTIAAVAPNAAPALCVTDRKWLQAGEQ